jgi:hypothetical protein
VEHELVLFFFSASGMHCTALGGAHLEIRCVRFVNLTEHFKGAAREAAAVI